MANNSVTAAVKPRDASYGAAFRKRVEAMGIAEVITSARSPRQNAYVERLIGSIRRECLDRVVVFNERHLLRILSSYVDYYHRSRTHLSLAKDCPKARPVMRRGKVIAMFAGRRPAPPLPTPRCLNERPAPALLCASPSCCEPSSAPSPLKASSSQARAIPALKARSPLSMEKVRTCDRQSSLDLNFW